ncbi:hypothetical protein BGZ65_009821 [Modicella reniformis]|uniref:Uncharacterized protein n=1 Tax=Modicella reniformis TaxID=1440133 RepID=A0A9P6SRW5_9FUNG|nr:hypothetical protein BGZ65_009821 [Modicella reniformis]
MAMTERAPANTYFQTTHTRVDSKLHSNPSLEKSDDLSFASVPSPISSGSLRRCAATRDLTSIGSNVNYFAKVSVEYMVGDVSLPFHASPWRYLATPDEASQGVIVDNMPFPHQLDTVRRFKKTLYTQLCPEADEGSEDTWPELSLFRKTDNVAFEPIEGDQEALYMFALKDGDRVVLLVHKNSRCSVPVVDPVAQWVDAVRAQTEFEPIDA